MDHSRLRASLAAAVATALGAGMAAGLVAAPADAKAKPLRPATTFTMLPDGSSGRTARGAQIPNIDSVKATLRTYYGATKGPDPADPAKAIYLPNLTTSPYATEVEGIAAHIGSTLPTDGSGKAVVFDVDSTLLADYGNEEEMHFSYNPALNAAWVNNGLFPAVPGMPALVQKLKGEGYDIYAITGRPAAQEDATIANLTKDGYTVGGTPIFDNAHVYTKPAAADVGSLPYLTCGTTCTTVQYKSLTRAQIQTVSGRTIVANVGDQWSDLQGGTPDATGAFKIPNPSYYLPSGTTQQPGLWPQTTFTMKPDGSSGKTAGGEHIPNIDSVKATIRAYYNATGGIADKSTSAYITEMTALAHRWGKKVATSCRAAAKRHRHPAVVFDVDDTTLWTYDMEDGAMAFSFDPALQDQWVQGERFPAVPGMTRVVAKATRAGCAVIGLTGRTHSQKKATLANLKKVGYHGFTKRLLFTKPDAGRPFARYLTCTACTTQQYKAGTRRYLETRRHFTIVANFGDQFSDLKGGHAQRAVKLPNPTYYLP